tara:strand:+ start:359 stop:2041 length:1683 start_codon:yes stop_codon:yes gene_type:complete
MKNVCIIGFGRAGKLQYKAISEINELNVISVIDLKKSVGSEINDTSFTRELTRAFESDIDAVIVTTPTDTHFDICKKCLMHKKHVFVEKPLANNIQQYKELYKLADEKNCCLFVGFNRRHDPEWLGLYEKIKNKNPLYISVVCRDHPFPPVSYLENCGGIFKDCVVHDIDMICYMLCSYPDTVECSVDTSGEIASTYLHFTLKNSTCRVNMIHSRHSPTYEQFVSVFCKDECFQIGREVLPTGTSFDTRYRESYKLQMMYFTQKICNNISPNISLSHSLQIERIIEACKNSSYSGEIQHLKSLRAYEAAETSVRSLYKEARTYHTPEKVLYLREKYGPDKFKAKMTIWEILEDLKSFKDISDPDVDVPNDQHALQTAESIRKAGLPDWLQFVGLIHDFGKILYKWGCDEDGTTMSTQFSIVGDTFVVGCDYPSSLVYPEFNCLVKEKYDKMGIYKPNCGLDNCFISFGHDEFLYQVLINSKTTLPSPALKIIRYHSLYAWHDKNEYNHLENEDDIMIKGWVKLFNTHDLYSKRTSKISKENVYDYYENLSKKYLPYGLCF